MRPIIKVSAQYSGRIEEVVKPMCERIVSRGDEALLFPLPGNLLTIIHHLSSNQIQYEIDHSDLS
jgi:hypothetical protein